MSQRNSHLAKIRDSLTHMSNKKLFALSWLEMEDVYQALDPLFIQAKRIEKLSLKAKGKVVIENDELVANDDWDDDNMQLAKMIFSSGMTLPHGESLKVQEREQEEEQEELVDYEPSPSVTHTNVMPQVCDDNDCGMSKLGEL